MFRDIRKKKNQISTEAAEQLLREARRGILAVNGREGYPYAIPINYYYDREAQKIYFHGARARSQGGSHPGLRQGVLHRLRRRDDPGGGVGAVPPERRGVRPVSPAGAEPGDHGAAEALRHEVLPGGAVGRRGDPAGWRCRPALRDRDPPPQRKRSAGEVSISSPVCSCRNRKRKTAPAGPMGLRVLLVPMFITTLSQTRMKSRFLAADEYISPKKSNSVGASWLKPSRKIAHLRLSSPPYIMEAQRRQAR